VPDAGTAAPPQRPHSRAHVALVLLLVVVCTGVGAWIGTEYVGTRGLPVGATDESGDVELLWQVMGGIAGAVAGAVFGLLGYAVVRGWRHRNGPEPVQSGGSTGLELLYTGIPVIIVAGIFGLSFWAWNDFGRDNSDDALHIDVTAFQWGWQFAYPDGPTLVGAQQDQPELVVPVGRHVAFELRSRDVAHSFFVPAFLTKLDVIPGVDNELVVTPDRVGVYPGHCAEFCGLLHANMNFTVRVLPADEFDAWLAQQRAQGGTGG
jgi:cytochrome c oxidase subunit 2